MSTLHWYLDFLGAFSLLTESRSNFALHVFHVPRKLYYVQAFLL